MSGLLLCFGLGNSYELNILKRQLAAAVLSNSFKGKGGILLK